MAARRLDEFNVAAPIACGGGVLAGATDRHRCVALSVNDEHRYVQRCALQRVGDGEPLGDVVGPTADERAGCLPRGPQVRDRCERDDRTEAGPGACPQRQLPAG